MASYPTSVKAFTTKNDGAGNTIFAAHVNDLQDEVTAIEDGILNGTAPLHSSNTIVNNFSVAGGSTIAGILNVAGNSSFAGAVHVGGASTFLGNVTVTGKFQSSQSTCQTLSVLSNSSFANSIYIGGANSSATLSSNTDIALPNAGALTWANSGNSSGLAAIGARDLGAIDSTTPVSLAFQGNSSIHGFIDVVVRGGGFLASGQFDLKGTGHAVGNVYTGGGNFGSTAGEAAKFNVYWSAANARYEIENKSASTVTNVSVIYRFIRN